MKKFPQKAVLAAIILSCGFVTHAETTAQRAQATRTKAAAERALHMLSAAEASQPNRFFALSDTRGSR